MPCDTYKTWLSAYLDGEIPAADRQLLERHLDTCALCTGELESLRGSQRLLRGLLAEEPPAELRPRIMAAIAATRPSPWSRLAALLQLPAPVARWSMAGAGLAAAIGVGITLLRLTPEAARPKIGAPSRATVIAAAPVVAPSAVKRAHAPKRHPALKRDVGQRPVAAPNLSEGGHPAIVQPDSGEMRLAKAIVRRSRARWAPRTASATRVTEARRGRTSTRPTTRRTGPLIALPAGPSAADGFDSLAPRSASMPPPSPTPDIEPEEPLMMMAAMPLVSSGGPMEVTPSSGDALAALRQRLAEQRREVPAPAVASPGSARDARSLPVRIEF